MRGALQLQWTVLRTCAYQVYCYTFFSFFQYFSLWTLRHLLPLLPRFHQLNQGQTIMRNPTHPLRGPRIHFRTGAFSQYQPMLQFVQWCIAIRNFWLVNAIHKLSLKRSKTTFVTHWVKESTTSLKALWCRATTSDFLSNNHLNTTMKFEIYRYRTRHAFLSSPSTTMLKAKALACL